MANYSSFYDFSGGPQLKQKATPYMNYGMNGLMRHTDGYSVEQGQQLGADAFDAMMAGYDNKSAGYADQLTALYKGYGQYAKEYGDKAQPIIDALNGDIPQMESYIKNYGSNLDEIKDTMNNGINLDPSATRTREQYQGNVAAANAKATDLQKQQMNSQGLNPYANTGATRATNLAGAASMADAANKAYADWHTQYNTDVQAKQKGMAGFADLQSRQTDAQSKLMEGRGLILGANKSIMDANIAASKDEATGMEGLASVNESRRAEALKLGQQQQENAANTADLTNQWISKQPEHWII
jgi:hypothetical protein